MNKKTANTLRIFLVIAAFTSPNFYTKIVSANNFLNGRITRTLSNHKAESINNSNNHQCSSYLAQNSWERQLCERVSGAGIALGSFIGAEQCSRVYRTHQFACQAAFTAAGGFILVSDICSGFEPDILGEIWYESEEGWQGTWERIGNSYNFNATWRKDGVIVTAKLHMILEDNQVTIYRSNSSDGNDCIYKGIISARKRTVQGTYKCNIGGTTWEASIW